ncbi:alpha-hydroxy-acid oxidizing protein [Streptomyces sp. NPDC058691]|uniref:alpha-hydroxy-acid oxidizing protein n=1 Tax=Streptomyces sp. NPDC058691 TaxID=3346601 RepID=UPI0036647FE5
MTKNRSRPRLDGQHVERGFVVGRRTTSYVRPGSDGADHQAHRSHAGFLPGISTLELLPGIVAPAGSTRGGVRDATHVVIALARGATVVGIGRPYAYALSYGGAESLTHFLVVSLVLGDLWIQGHRRTQGRRLRTGHGSATPSVAVTGGRIVEKYGRNGEAHQSCGGQAATPS